MRCLVTTAATLIVLAICIVPATSNAQAADSTNSEPTTDRSTRITELRADAEYAEALVVARELLRLRQQDPEAERWAIEDAERLVGTLESATGLDASAQQELAAADRMTGEIDGHYDRGEYGAGAELARRQLEIRRRLLGEPHVDVATSLVSQSMCLEKHGDLAAAEPPGQQALAMRIELLGAVHPDVTRCQNNLAIIYAKQGKMGKAEIAFADALATKERLLGPEHLSVASGLENLSNVYAIQGRYAEAEPLIKRALSIREKELGPDHRKTGQALNTLGNLYAQQGKYEDAEPILLRALAIREKALGESHPNLAKDYNSLAILYRIQGRYEEAERLLERTLAIKQKAFGPESSNVVMSMNSLAIVYQTQGRYADAEQQFVRAFNIGEKTLGLEHKNVASILINLAALYRQLGNYAAAEAVFKQALATLTETAGPRHPSVATNLNNLGQLYQMQGRLAEAEAVMQQALDIREEKLGPDHDKVAMVLGSLAVVYQAQGNYTAAEPLLLRSLAIDEKVFGPDNVNLAPTLTTLALLYLELPDKHAQAEPLLKRALALRERAVGAEHADVARSTHYLAQLCDRQERYDEANAYFEQAARITAAAVGSQHPRMCAILTDQARCLLAQGETDTAASLLAEAARVFEVARLRAGSGMTRATYTATPYALLAAARLAAGSREGAWSATELAHGRVLADLVANSDRRSLSAVELAREDSLQTALSRLEEELSALQEAVYAASGDESAAGQRDGVLVADLEKTRSGLLAAQAQWAHFQHDVSTRYPVTEGQAFALERIQRTLSPTTALLGWLAVEITPEQYAAWGYVIRDHGPVRWNRLGISSPELATSSLTEGPRQLQQALSFAAAWRERVEDVDEINALAAGVWAGWGAPLVHHLNGVEHLVIVPSGPMLGVPVEALVDAAGGYVGERYAITYTPSATVFSWLRERPAPVRGSENCLLVGDPPFTADHQRVMEHETSALQVARATIDPLPDAGILRSALGGDREALGRLPRLRWTRREVESLQATFHRTTTLLGPRASETEVASLVESDGLRRFSTIHLATHALVDDARPERSALVLAQTDLPDPLESVRAGRKIHDGLLTAREIVREWKLEADLVTLSGCQTGLGQRVAGEGYVGLAHALLQAGARNLLVSLWRVEDEATCLLMTRFYENITGSFTGRRGDFESEPLAKAIALREAKHWLRTWADDTGKQIYRHPVYWSAFILIGPTE